MKSALSILIASVFGLLVGTQAESEEIYPQYQIHTPFHAGDGKIVIYSYHLDELLETTYRHANRYDQHGLLEIVHLFRSRSDNRGHYIDIKLIELLDHLQDYFEADALELISGYRSPSLNRHLRRNSANVAQHSMHLKGQAADIHIDEVTEEVVAEYLRSLRVGGVGYYPALDFVHVDTGEVRNWDLPDRRGRLLMGMRKGARWQITTDRDLYFPGEAIPYEILNIKRTQKTLQKLPDLEIFRRGKWKVLHPLSAPKDVKLSSAKTWRSEWLPSKADPFGRYRVVIPGPKGFPHLEVRSNEFYRKKK